MDNGTRVDTIVACIEAAADYIRVHGWLAAGPGLNGGPRSIDGALASAVASGYSEADGGLGLGQEACRAFEEMVGTDVARWNDLSCRDGREAERMLRAVAGALVLRDQRRARRRRVPHSWGKALSGPEERFALLAG
ncbi:MAG: DUF6197 family protein [Candidatus Dormibacteria bacterium]